MLRATTVPLPSSSLLHFSAVLFRRDLWSNRSSQFHKETQIVFHLQPVTSCVHCGWVLSCSVKKHDRFYLWQCYYYCLWVIGVLALWSWYILTKVSLTLLWALFSCSHLWIFEQPLNATAWLCLEVPRTYFFSTVCVPSSWHNTLWFRGCTKTPPKVQSPTPAPISINSVTVATKCFKSRHKRWGLSGVVIQWRVKREKTPRLNSLWVCGPLHCRICSSRTAEKTAGHFSLAILSMPLCPLINVFASFYIFCFMRKK